MSPPIPEAPPKNRGRRLPAAPARGAAVALAIELLDRSGDAARRLADPSDPEALHDFRVAVRRLHANLRAYRGVLGASAAKKSLRRLDRMFAATNPLRDAEVLGAWLRAHRHEFGARGRVGAVGLLRDLDRRHLEEGIRKRRKILKRFKRTERKLRRRLSRDEGRGSPRSAARTFGAAVLPRILRRSAKLAARLRRITDVDAARKAHKARLGVKRLRYLLEPFTRVSEGWSPAVEELKALQDLLGRIHDRAVFSERIAEAPVGRSARASAMRLLETQQRGLFSELKRRWLGQAADSLESRLGLLARTLAPRARPPASHRYSRSARLAGDSRSLTMA